MAKIQKITLVTVILCASETAILAEKQHSCVFSKDDSFKRYTCVTTLAGTISQAECAFRCCSQNRCIGVFHDQLSSVCLLINATEKKEICDVFNWNTWQAYRKQEEFGECSGYLRSTVGYSLFNICGLEGRSENCRLFYEPSGSNEIGGGNVVLIPDEHPRCILLKLAKPVTVRGMATQGRWRNESLDSCCDERVTSYTIHYSVDCDIEWTFIWVDNMKIFEANVIPDAGNEVIINLFEQPLFGKCFAFYPASSHGQPIARLDLIGCES